jgi:2-dehydropantoate 2-reductase
MKHAILGAGAIGGLVGTALSSLGEDVTVVVRPQSLPSFPGNLSLEHPSGALTGPAKAVATLTEPVDLLWIATKTYQLETALETVQVLPGCVVPLLNGVDHIAVLAAQFGRERVVPATIAVEAERIAPGRFIQRSPFVRLNLAANREPRLGAVIAQLGDLAFTCQFIPNEQILADAAWKQKLSSALAETCAVATASGAQVDARQIQAVFDSVPPGMRSSMQKDLAAGRQLELDAIGGPIVRGGKHYGIDVPTTVNLMAAIGSKTVAR